MKFEEMVPILMKMQGLNFGCWFYDNDLSLVTKDAYRTMDLRLAELKTLTDTIEKFSDTDGLLCRITYSYWLCQIVGNQELVKKYGLVLTGGKESECFVPEVTVRILLEGTPLIIKVFPSGDGGLTYCWGGSNDWEMSLPEVMKKLEEGIGKIHPLT